MIIKSKDFMLRESKIKFISKVVVNKIKPCD